MIRRETAQSALAASWQALRAELSHRERQNSREEFQTLKCVSGKANSLKESSSPREVDFLGKKC